MEKVLELRRELLNAVDNKSNDKKDLMNAIEEVSKKLLLFYWEQKNACNACSELTAFIIEDLKTSELESV